MNNITITYTTVADCAAVFSFFDASIVYQEQRGYPSWKNYDKQAIMRDIENENQFKVMLNGEIAIVFSICYQDEIIWRDREKGDALYLHRIVVSPHFKGRKLFGEILKWSINHCREKSLKYVRMDTWAENSNIIDYYKTFGFRVIETITTPDTVALPEHNRNLKLTLMEIIVEKMPSHSSATLL